MISATDSAANRCAIGQSCLECTRRWIRVIWVCRVSTCSVAGGTLLFVLPQVQDLFLDVAGVGDLQFNLASAPGFFFGVLVRFLFALWVFVFWALPTHAIARLAVTDPAWLNSPYGLEIGKVDKAKMRRAFAPAVKWVPRLLGGFCFIGPVLGAALAAHAPLWTWDSVLRKRTLFEIASTEIFLVGLAILFGFYVIDRRGWFNNRANNILGWLMRPARIDAIHRQVPERPRVGDGSDETRLAVRIDWFISTLIAIFLIVVLVAAGRIDVVFARLWLIPLLLGAWTPIFGALGRLSHCIRAPAILGFIVVLILIDHFAGDDHVIDLRSAAGETQLSFDQAVQRWAHENGCDHDNSRDALKTCPSPIIVATEGGASRSAFFTTTVLGLLADATCEYGWKTPQERGISTPSRPDGPKLCDGTPLFNKQLFAISGVSGGAVAAGMFARALLDDRVSDSEMVAVPCRTDVATDNYFGGTQIWTWRACLQAMAARDFLTPVMAGLAFRDVLAFLGGWFPQAWPDRGHRLEDSLADAYDHFVPPPTAAKGLGGLRANFLDLAPTDGAPWRPIVLLNATSVGGGERFVFSTVKSLPPIKDGAPPNRDEFQDALATNAFDFYEETAATRAPGGASAGCDLALVQAMHNSARFPVISPAGRIPRPGDHCEPDAVDLDQVVDGGYFDNYGALAVHDLVRALQKKNLHPFLLLITNSPDEAPVVDPNGEPTIPAADWSLEPPKAPSTQSSLPIFLSPLKLIPLIVQPLDAVIAARSAHGEYGVRLTRRLLDPDIDDGGDLASADAGETAHCFVRDQPIVEPCYAHVAVFPQSSGGSMGGAVKDVSMSWWVSKTVQEYLDEQVQAPPDVAVRPLAATAGQKANRAALYKVCAALRSGGRPVDWCKRSVDETTGYATSGG